MLKIYFISHQIVLFGYSKLQLVLQSTEANQVCEMV